MFMPPPYAFDTREPKIIGSAVNSAIATAGTTITQAATIPAGCTALVVTVTSRGGTGHRASSVTFNSLALGNVASTVGIATGDTTVSMFVMYDPPVGTTANVVATMANTITAGGVSIRYLSGVNACESQSAAASTTGAGILSTTLTARTSSIVIQGAHLSMSAGTPALTNADEQATVLATGTSIQHVHGSKRFRRPFSVAQTFSHGTGTRTSNATYPSLFIAVAFRWRNSAIRLITKGWYTSTAGAAGASGAHTFNNVDIGQAPRRTEDRHVVLFLFMKGPSGVGTITIPTIDGTVFTKRAGDESTVATSDIGVDIWDCKTLTGSGLKTLTLSVSNTESIQAYVCVVNNAWDYSGIQETADAASHTTPWPTTGMSTNRRNRNKTLIGYSQYNAAGTAFTISDDQTPDVFQLIDQLDHPYTASNQARSIMAESIGNWAGGLGIVSNAKLAAATISSVGVACLIGYQP